MTLDRPNPPAVPGFRRTLICVPLEFSTTDASEVVALDLYRTAEETGQPITEKTVRDRIAELLEHPPGCRRCSGRCRMTARARPAQVLWLAREWQRVATRSGCARCRARLEPGGLGGDTVAKKLPCATG